MDIPTLAQPGKLKFQPRPKQLELAISLLAEGYIYASAVSIVDQTMKEFGIEVIDDSNLADIKQAIILLHPAHLGLN